MGEDDEIPSDFQLTFFEIPLPAGGTVNASTWPAREGGWRYAVYRDELIIREGWSATIEAARAECWAAI